MKQALPWILVVVAVLLMLDVGGPQGDQPADPDHPSLAIMGDPAIRVVEMDAADVPMDCPEPTRCDGDYRAFLEKVAEHRSPRDAGQLLESLAALDPTEERPPVDDLAVTIADEAGIDFLLDGLDDRELLVVERSNEASSGIQQIRLGFEDPFVGVLEGLFLMPGTPPPWAGVVVFPGAGGTLESGRDSVDAVELAGAGVAVLVVQPRLNGGEALEADLSLRLLSAGSSLSGLRAYEVVLARKYLRWRADVLADRLVLVTGPGAGEVGDLAARLGPWAGYAGPPGSDWLALGEDGRPTKATVPGLVGLLQLDDDATLGFPVRRFDGAGPGQVAAFVRGAALPPSDLDPGPAVGSDLGEPEAEHPDPGQQQPHP